MRCVVTTAAEGQGYRLAGFDGLTIDATDSDDLLFHFDKTLTVALQRLRTDLLFLHAAALEFEGKAYLLVGDSGNGKSTTAWGLLHHGFRYLSDELSPIDLESMRVHPYLRCLRLKKSPPAPYPMPITRLTLPRGTCDVPVEALPLPAITTPCPIGAVLFVHYLPGLASPVIRPIGQAEAAARMYSNTLNALAHPRCGLDAVAEIVGRVASFALDAAELRATCEAVCGLLAGKASPR